MFLLIWNYENNLIQAKIKHFIDFENTKAILKPLTGMTAGQNILGTCLPK